MLELSNPAGYTIRLHACLPERRALAELHQSGGFSLFGFYTCSDSFAGGPESRRDLHFEFLVKAI